MSIRHSQISAMSDRLSELGRAGASLSIVLKESNDPEIRSTFEPILERLNRIQRAESAGNTFYLIDDLKNIRSAIRRLKLPDIDPVLDAPTPALRALRTERANLVEAVDNALEAAHLLVGLQAPDVEVPFLVDGKRMLESFVRLDERLAAVSENIAEMKIRVDGFESRSHDLATVDLFRPHLESLEIQADAAIFETACGIDSSVTSGSDLNSLSRSISNMGHIASDLGNLITTFKNFLDKSLAFAGTNIVHASRRAVVGFKSVIVDLFGSTLGGRLQSERGYVGDSSDDFARQIENLLSSEKVLMETVRDLQVERQIAEEQASRLAELADKYASQTSSLQSKNAKHQAALRYIIQDLSELAADLPHVNSDLPPAVKARIKSLLRALELISYDLDSRNLLEQTSA